MADKTSTTAGSLRTKLRQDSLICHIMQSFHANRIFRGWQCTDIIDGIDLIFLVAYSSTGITYVQRNNFFRNRNLDGTHGVYEVHRFRCPYKTNEDSFADIFVHIQHLCYICYPRNLPRKDNTHALTKVYRGDSPIWKKKKKELM